MMTRSHRREVVLPAVPERVFALLHTPSDICGWWGAARAIVNPAPGGVWAAAWGDDADHPDYISTAVMRVFDPPRRLVLAEFGYVSKDGPLPFEAAFTIEFTIEPHEHGALLRVTQDGFPTNPSADDFFHACEQGWADTFDGIHRYVQQL